jgi:hypothetical protein
MYAHPPIPFTYFLLFYVCCGLSPLQVGLFEEVMKFCDFYAEKNAALTDEFDRSVDSRFAGDTSRVY